jgi:hypothetical protein
MATMMAVAVTCVFVDPAAGAVVGVLLGLGEGALLACKAWVDSRLRRRDSEYVLAESSCDLVPPASPLHALRAILEQM